MPIKKELNRNIDLINREFSQILNQMLAIMSANSHLVIRDKEGNYLYASPNLEQSLIDSRVLAQGEHIVGKNLKEVYPSDYKQILENDETVMSQGAEITFHEFS
jgi:hypothetical protein